MPRANPACCPGPSLVISPTIRVLLVPSRISAIWQAPMFAITPSASLNCLNAYSTQKKWLIIGNPHQVRDRQVFQRVGNAGMPGDGEYVPSV